jgi:hypothetical protein
VKELPGGKNVVLQQLEHDDMASEHQSDKPAIPERDQPRQVRPPSQPAPQRRPPLQIDGIELLRDGNC